MYFSVWEYILKLFNLPLFDFFFFFLRKVQKILLLLLFLFLRFFVHRQMTAQSRLILSNPISDHCCSKLCTMKKLLLIEFCNLSDVSKSYCRNNKRACVQSCFPVLICVLIMGYVHAFNSLYELDLVFNIIIKCFTILLYWLVHKICMLLVSSYSSNLFHLQLCPTCHLHHFSPQSLL